MDGLLDDIINGIIADQEDKLEKAREKARLAEPGKMPADEPVTDRIPHPKKLRGPSSENTGESRPEIDENRRPSTAA